MKQKCSGNKRDKFFFEIGAAEIGRWIQVRKGCFSDKCSNAIDFKVIVDCVKANLNDTLNICVEQWNTFV